MSDDWNFIKYFNSVADAEDCECDISLELLHAVERDYTTFEGIECSEETVADYPCTAI